MAYRLLTIDSKDFGSLRDIQPCTRSNTLVAEQGRKHRCGPGEQRRRGYEWDVDTERHTFGRPGSLAVPLSLDCGGEPHSRLVSKKLDDFRETQDVVGRVKNLGHDSRDHLGKVPSHEPSTTIIHITF